MSLLSQRGYKRLGWPIAGVAAAAMVVSTFAVDQITAQQATVQEQEPVIEPGRPSSFADIVEQVRSAVVNITVTQAARQPTFSFPGQQGTPFDEFFERFFDGRMPQPEAPQQRRQGVGSGFVVDPEGYVVTNNHVVQNAEEIIVTLENGEELPAEVVGTDPATDLALIRIDNGGDLPFLQFGDSSDARVGDWVLTIGNPFALGGTATAGIISARGRNIQSGPYDDYLQIDAPINSGNSGGPVFNTAGEVIGVNTAILSPSGGNVGIGFAIPANQAASVIAQLKETGNVTRGWLGVQIQELDEDLAATFGVSPDTGVLVTEVFEGGPAAAAGLRSGDVITEFAGESVDSVRTLTRTVAEHQPGEQVEVAILRQGDESTLEVDLGTRGEAEQIVGRSSGAPGPGQPSEAGSLGLELAPLDERVRSELGLPSAAEGVLIANVAPQSPAAEKGLRPGDVIVEVNQMPVTSVNEAVTALRTARQNDAQRALLLIRRGDAQQFVALSFE